MNNLHKIQSAIFFAVNTHEIHQKQKRKGKDHPYIIHPLTVGLLLASAGADTDLICAGILHDTIEDSVEEHKVTKEDIKLKFGEQVASLVDEVTEKDKSLTWEERKKEALNHISDMSEEVILLKSADLLANSNEFFKDFREHGFDVFTRFNAEAKLWLHYKIRTLRALLAKSTDSPFKEELSKTLRQFADIFRMLRGFKPKILDDYDFNKLKQLNCPVCGWEGEKGSIGHYNDLFDVECPDCSYMIYIVPYPLKKFTKSVEEVSKWASELTQENLDSLSDDDVLAFVSKKPGHKEVYGFVLDPKQFDGNEHAAVTVKMLTNRLNNISDVEGRLYGKKKLTHWDTMTDAEKKQKYIDMYMSMQSLIDSGDLDEFSEEDKES